MFLWQILKTRAKKKIQIILFAFHDHETNIMTRGMYAADRDTTASCTE